MVVNAAMLNSMAKDHSITILRGYCCNNDADEEQASEAKATSSTSRIYSIVDVLGEGSSGIVYEVQNLSDRSDCSSYACKVVKLVMPSQQVSNCYVSSNDKNEGATPISACLREISIMKGFMSHPNLPTFRECFFEGPDNCCIIISDVARGGTLKDALDFRGNLPEEDARAVLFGVLNALEHMHSIGIAHRDLKLENVLLLEEGCFSKVQIHDMGMAKHVGRAAPKRCHTRCGTPLFIAPEILAPPRKDGVFDNEHKNNDTAKRDVLYGTQVDMWACGVLLYTILSGYHPFGARSMRGLWRAIRACDYCFDDPVWHLISDEAKSLVRKLLVVDPDIRLTAAEALRHPWLSS